MGLAMGGRRWRGRALCAIAGVHTLVAGVEFAPVWRELWAAGVVDSVGRDPLRGAVAWFFLFGVLLAVLEAVRGVDAGAIARGVADKARIPEAIHEARVAAVKALG